VLTIGIDARAATEVPAGRGRVVRELLAALVRRDDDDVRYVLYAREAWDERLDERFAWRLVGSRDPLWHLRAATAARHDDVFLSTNSYLTAWFLRPPSIPFVYDLVPFVEGARAQARAGRIERATIGPAMRRAAALLCISEATRRDLAARFPKAGHKAFVAQLAADERFFAVTGEAAAGVRARHGLDRPFVLAAGTLEPRKNIPALIAAYARLPEDVRAAHQLVIVGPEGWEMQETLRAAQAREADVRLLGHVSDEDLAALYRACTVFCYPSLYEGFGLPVLEAMAAGAAVLTSDVSSLPEVGGDAVAYADPLRPDAIAGALERLLADPGERARLGAGARERARTFSWERFAGEVLDAARAVHLAASARR
jgi:glycosyltransferase involved in cell wall biosynthesis